MKSNKKAAGILYISKSALIAASYAALTLIMAPISFGSIQLRLSEALAILPLYTNAAVPGLTVGCIIANCFGGNGLPDIVFGSIASLLSAIGVRLFRKVENERLRRYFMPLPVILINGIIIGWELSCLYELPLFLTMLEVSAGETLVMYSAGIGLDMLLKERAKRIFGEDS